jgi:RNA polymerase sigma-70 factor (ECF subfamily)
MTTSEGSRADSGRLVHPDAGWVDGVPADHHEALRDVYGWHHDRLIGFFVNRTGDRQLTEDLAHDTLLRFACALDSLDDGRPVWPYLRAVAQNILIDFHRRRQRRSELDVLAPDSATGRRVDPDIDEAVAMRALLNRAMDDLPDRQRTAVELRLERGWSIVDAAAFIGVSPNTFNQLLLRARRKLQASLERSGGTR